MLDPLVIELIAEQRATGETNEVFAGRLGVTRQHWMGVKRGRYPAGPKVQLGADRLQKQKETRHSA